MGDLEGSEQAAPLGPPLGQTKPSTSRAAEPKPGSTGPLEVSGGS
jgi:hypothetical protein